MESDQNNTGCDASIAVLIPCYNEATTINRVIEDFRRELPEARIIVFDNNSTDATAQIAREAGADVYHETVQGKGNVVRAMFRKIQARYYILTDGDLTYPAEYARKLLQPICDGKADMVVGNRMADAVYDHENKRLFHSFGNRLVRGLVNYLFKAKLEDIMSGYRAFNRTFVKTAPLLSQGFEIETEMTLHALDKHFSIVEVPIRYRDRPKNSSSKLNTYTDGFRVIKTIAFVFKNYKPMVFFGIISIIICLSGIGIGIPTILEFIEYHYVYKVPSAILAASLEIMAMLLLCCGIILETVVTQHKESFEIQLKSFLAHSLEEDC